MSSRTVPGGARRGRSTDPSLNGRRTTALDMPGVEADVHVDAAGRITAGGVERLIMHRFPIDRFHDAFEAARGADGIEVMAEFP
jgi:hypothetical protein